ncbi:hypothetical protein DNTS_029475, partial [Danionella cerebrum]
RIQPDQSHDYKTEADVKLSESSSVDEQTSSSTENIHTVTCTLSFAVAILNEHEECAAEKRKGPKKEASSEVLKAPKAQGYYCIEYKLLPDDPEPTRVDLVMFGLAAKLYLGSETKVLKPWREANQVWVSWTQTLRLNVTRELLIKMTSHKIVVRVWESKDKVSFKAKNDRPKAFRIPQESSGDDPVQNGGIKKMVCKMRATYDKQNLRPNRSNHPQIVPSKSDLTNEKNQIMPTKKTSFSKILREVTELNEVNPEMEAASLELSLAPLLAGSVMLIGCLEFCFKGVKEGFCCISLDQQLISEQLKVELNPLVIKVLSASCLPAHPIQGTYLPVYCQYKFHNQPTYRTEAHAHNTNIHFRDVNVIFVGLMSHGKLIEFLRGPPMEIEVHDRDKINDKPPIKPAIFGTDPNDSKIADVDLWTNGMKEGNKCSDPYGISKLDFLELLDGCRYLKQMLPIRCSSTQHLGHRECLSDPAPVIGQYIEAGTQLKVQVEIACPLHIEDAKEDEECPFGRIIYVFKYNNTLILNKLKSEIAQINAEAFKLNLYSEETIQRVLFGHKTTTKEREGKTLDILTGFHVMDKDLHIFVLEGLKKQAVKRLWTTVPVKLDQDEEKRVAVLFNSDMSFSKRLYEMFDVSLSPICLHKPLETIMKEPLLFIRNAVPHACLEAMKRLTQICRAKSLKEAVRNNLFPTADMILSFKKEFGQNYGTFMQQFVPETQGTEDILVHNIRRRAYTPIDHFNKEYSQRKRSERLNEKDFIQANIVDIHKASNNLRKSKPCVFFEDVSDPTNSSKSAETPSSEPSRYSNCTSFSYPGFKSSIESNQHPKRPDDARIEELQKPWREKVFHANKLKPTLSRTRLPWNQRNKDFELYSKPPALFGPELPQSLHLAGDTLHEEQSQAARAQYNRWLRKAQMSEISGGNGRAPEFRCHMRKAKLDKLQDILKDKPMKYSLKRAGMVLKFSEKTSSVEEINIPFAPGPFQNHSLSWDKNTVPRLSSQFSKYHF